MSFRWVILGAGSIAGKFADAVRQIDGTEVIGVGSRAPERGAAFAQKHDIPHSGSYEEMLTLRPDAAYIAATTEAHASLTRLCINAGIPVLCEKAMFMSAAEAEEVFALAEAKGVFCMEATWSLMLPAVQAMKGHLDTGVIGQVRHAEIAIGWNAPDGPGSRFYEPSLGGGAAYDLLIYCYELAEFYLGEPDAIETVAVHWAPTGVDETESVVLRYPWGLAHLTASIATRLDERASLNGEKGTLSMPKPHCGPGYTLRLDDGTVQEFPFDQRPNGFIPEVKEAMRCIQAGLLESPCVPHALTLRCAKLFDRLNVCK